MPSRPTRRQVLRITAAGAALRASGAFAQAPYPVRPIRLLVGFAPGGFTDLAARVLAEELGRSLGQPVIVENRPGANGLLASDATMKAAADGYTLHLCSMGFTTNPLLTTRSYDPVRDFTPLSLLAIVPNVLVVHPSVPAKTLRELLELAHARQRPLTQASAGIGSPGHLSGALLKMMTGVNIDDVPYKGSGPAMNDLLGGQVDLSFPTVPTALPYVTAGRLRAIAVTSARRSPQMPDVSTVAEAGVPGYDMGGWYALVGPAGLPPEVTRVLGAELKRILQLAQVRQRFMAEGAEPVGSSPSEFADFLSRDSRRWSEVIKAVHLAPGDAKHAVRQPS
jgi:tripartite-type tricarboxylate transporter receptor subunit TctC